MKCDLCNRAVRNTVDVWAQGMTHSDDTDDPEESKGYELESDDCESDYISVCFDCWRRKLVPLWNRLVRRTQEGT